MLSLCDQSDWPEACSFLQAMGKGMWNSHSIKNLLAHVADDKMLIYSSGDVCHHSTAWFELAVLSLGGCGLVVVAQCPNSMKGSKDLYSRHQLLLGQCVDGLVGITDFKLSLIKLLKNSVRNVSLSPCVCHLLSEVSGVYTEVDGEWCFLDPAKHLFILFSGKRGKNLVHLSVLI